MAYEGHIELLSGEPLSLEQWLAAVEAVEGVRLIEDGSTLIKNPRTGEVIQMDSSPIFAEVLFPDSGKWHNVFNWHDGTVSFNLMPSFQEPSDIVKQKAFSLASQLGAQIVGDEGEVYE